MEMTEIDIAWIRRRANELEREDLTPSAARMIAIQEVCKRRQSRESNNHGTLTPQPSPG